MYGIIFHLLKRLLFLENFWKFRPLWYSLQICTVHVASTDLSFIQDSQILRHTKQKRVVDLPKSNQNLTTPPTYLLSSNTIKTTCDIPSNPVLHYISVTYRILWHYISVTHIFDLFTCYNIGGTPCTRISDREFWMVIIGVCYWFMINLYYVYWSVTPSLFNPFYWWVI